MITWTLVCIVGGIILAELMYIFTVTSDKDTFRLRLTYTRLFVCTVIMLLPMDVFTRPSAVLLFLIAIFNLVLTI